MLGPGKCDDLAYAQLLKAIGETGRLPDIIESEALRAQIARGLGLNTVPDDRQGLETAVSLPQAIPALSYDLTFPEVFYAMGVPHGRAGFHAVLGNPPWDKLRVESRELLSTLEPEMLVGKEHARTASDAELIEAASKRYPDIDRQRTYVSGVKSVMGHLYGASNNSGIGAQGDLDLYQLFSLLSADRTSTKGRVGMLAGGGLVKNPADSAVRIVLARLGYWSTVFHFINTRKLFPDLPPVIEFTVYVWSRLAVDRTRLLMNAETDQGLPEIADKQGLVCGSEELREQLIVTGFFPITQAGLGHDCTNLTDLSSWLSSLGVRLTSDLHRTGAEEALRQLSSLGTSGDDAREPSLYQQLITRGFVPAYSGKSIRHFDDYSQERAGRWDPRVELVATVLNSESLRVIERARYFRFAVRATCGSPRTNARSVTTCILCPGSLATNSILIDGFPQERPNANALLAAAVLNTFVVDARARPRISANFNDAIMTQVEAPVPSSQQQLLLVHGALRLSSNHTRFQSLWREQLVDTWREPGRSPFTWPVLSEVDDRWRVRAALDSVVADAYGLSRDQYAHVLSTFSHKSYPKAAEVCLAMFDELKSHRPRRLHQEARPLLGHPAQREPPTASDRLAGCGSGAVNGW